MLLFIIGLIYLFIIVIYIPSNHTRKHDSNNREAIKSHSQVPQRVSNDNQATITKDDPAIKRENELFIKEFPQKFTEDSIDLLKKTNSFKLICTEKSDIYHSFVYSIFSIDNCIGLVCGIKGEIYSNFNGKCYPAIQFKRVNYVISSKTCNLISCKFLKTDYHPNYGSAPQLKAEVPGTVIYRQSLFGHGVSNSVEYARLDGINNYYSNFPVFKDEDDAINHFQSLYKRIEERYPFEPDEFKYDYSPVHGGYGIDKYIDFDQGSTVHIPTSHLGRPVIAIKESAFEKNSIVDLYVGKNIQTVYSYAFSWLKKGSFIHFPDNHVIEVMPNAFSGCKSSLIANNFGKAFKPHEKGFYRSFIGIGSLIIEEQSYLQDEMFRECSGLKNVTICTPIKEIGNRTFYDSSIENIILPDTLKRIGEEAFFGCKRLETITIPASVIQIGKNCFVKKTFKDINLRKDGGYDLRYKEHWMTCYEKMDILIECEQGSYAHRYAIENEIEYVLK